MEGDTGTQYIIEGCLKALSCTVLERTALSGNWVTESHHHARIPSRLCPRKFDPLNTTIANSYTQELNRLSLIARDSVEFYGVVSEPNVTREAATKHLTQYDIDFPVLFANSGLIAVITRL